VLGGNAAVLTPTAVATTGTFAETGVAATFRTTLAAATQGYLFSWQTFSDVDTLVVEPGAFALAGGDVRFSYDIDLGGIGAGIAGGQFTRSRWRELKESERKRAEDLRRARDANERRAREAAEALAAQALRAKAAARDAEDQVHAERARAQALADALAALAGAQRLSGEIGAAHAIEAVARNATADRLSEQEEEEAIVHLLSVA
jgi:hypothetical protein